MDIIFSPDQLAHHAAAEFNRGKLGPSFEHPGRAETILAAVAASEGGDVSPPEDFGIGPILAVHDRDYVEFLRGVWDRWQAAGRPGDAMPLAWPQPELMRVRPRSIDGELGLYCADIGTPITAGTWRAAYASAQVALTAAARVHAGTRYCFGLCRPPGHHAGKQMYMGYSFLNNAAIAAEWLIASGHRRVTVLDVDYHHGNGTQAIFYDRPDVQFISLHADPDDAFPFFLGRADETGTGAGAGTTLNLPLPEGTDWPAYSKALDTAFDAVRAFGPSVVVISLGVDTFEEDPISRFRFKAGDFLSLGRRLASLDLPMPVIMEGGYAVAALGANVASVLKGLQQGA